MNSPQKASQIFSHISLRRVAIVGLILAWTVLSTVVAVPAPPPGAGGQGPG